MGIPFSFCNWRFLYTPVPFFSIVDCGCKREMSFLIPLLEHLRFHDYCFKITQYYCRTWFFSNFLFMRYSGSSFHCCRIRIETYQYMLLQKALGFWFPFVEVSYRWKSSLEVIFLVLGAIVGSFACWNCWWGMGSRSLNHLWI